MFPFKTLPTEMRFKIYPDALQLQHDGQAPALLLALTADKALYDEAVTIYCKINVNITKKNEDSFKKESLPMLLKFKYIRISWKDDEKEIQLKANKVLLRNNFEIITIDLSQRARERVNSGVQYLSQALIRASSTPKKLIIKFRGGIPQEVRQTEPISDFINLANAALQVVGKLERVTPADCPELWFWGEDGRILWWN